MLGVTINGGEGRRVHAGWLWEISRGECARAHTQKLDNKRGERGEDVVAVGGELLVKVIEIDQQGRINLSRKDALADLEAKKRQEQ